MRTLTDLLTPTSRVPLLVLLWGRSASVDQYNMFAIVYNMTYTKERDL